MCVLEYSYHKSSLKIINNHIYLLIIKSLLGITSKINFLNRTMVIIAQICWCFFINIYSFLWKKQYSYGILGSNKQANSLIESWNIGQTYIGYCIFLYILSSHNLETGLDSFTLTQKILC